MKKRELSNLRSKDLKELQKQLYQLRSKVATIAPKIAAGVHSNLKEKKNLRRDIAQILSIMQQKSTKEGETK